jgi:hypothetical protein
VPKESDALEQEIPLDEEPCVPVEKPRLAFTTVAKMPWPPAELPREPVTVAALAEIPCRPVTVAFDKPTELETEIDADIPWPPEPDKAKPYESATEVAEMPEDERPLVPAEVA